MVIISVLQGIYQIKNIHNDKVYIGSSVNIGKRYTQHIYDLKYNIHQNHKLKI